MATADAMARDAAKKKLATTKAFGITATPRAPAKKPYKMSLGDIAGGLTNPALTNPDAAGGMGIAESGKKIVIGKGEPLDYLSVGAAGLGLLSPGLGGAAKAAKAGATAAKTGVNTARAGLDFKKAYQIQNLTDYSKSGVPAYTHPDFVASVSKMGSLSPGSGVTTAREVAQSRVGNATRDLARQQMALRAQKFWETKPENPLAIYDELAASPVTVEAGMQGYLSNVPSIVAGRSSADIAADIAKITKTRDAAAGYLKSPVTKLNVLGDVAKQSFNASGSGFSGLSPVADLVSAGVEGLPGGVKAVVANKLARHRSSSTELGGGLMHPSEVPVSSGRVFGPGTYFAQTPKLSNEIFSSFGPNVYKMKEDLGGIIKTIKSKGYIDPSNPKAAGINSSAWDSDLIQNLIKDGYIGFKHGDAVTNWMVGTKGGPELVLTNDALKTLDINKYIEKMLSGNKRTARVIPQQPQTPSNLDYGLMPGRVEG